MLTHSERCGRCIGKRNRGRREAEVEARRPVRSKMLISHLEKLRRAGFTGAEIAQAAGLSEATVSRASRPGFFVRVDNAEAPLELRVLDQSAAEGPPGQAARGRED